MVAVSQTLKPVSVMFTILYYLVTLIIAAFDSTEAIVARYYNKGLLQATLEAKWVVEGKVVSYCLNFGGPEAADATPIKVPLMKEHNPIVMAIKRALCPKEPSLCEK